MIGPITLMSIWLRNCSIGSSSSGPATAMPALLTRPASVSPPSAARTSRAAASTAASSVTSNNKGVKLAPNSLFKTLGIGLLAHAAEHPKSAIEQHFCGGPADAG